MKKTLSILLTLLLLVGMLAVGTVSVSAAVKTTDAAFTDNFVLLDYIENTNGQYIKTGYNAGANVTVSLDLEITDWNGEWGAIFGSRTDTYSTNSFIACQNSNQDYLRAEIGKGTYSFPSVKSKTRCTVAVSGTEQFTGTGLEMYLFKVNGKWLPSAIYKLYSCKITDNGEVKRDFVPAKRKSDNAVGLYDLQNSKFYGSASGTGFAMTKEHKFHAFDRNGKCACGTTFSIDDYCGGGYGYDKTLSFSGAKSLTVKIIKLNAWTGSIDFRDGQGNVIEKYSGVYGAVDYTITIPGDTLRVTYMGGKGDANYKVNGGFELASITPNYDDNTGSVLSEGNLWIIIAVAVLAIGGVATLFIVKKKKKPIAANGASTDEE